MPEMARFCMMEHDVTYFWVHRNMRATAQRRNLLPRAAQEAEIWFGFLVVLGSAHQYFGWYSDGIVACCTGALKQHPGSRRVA